MARRGNIMKLLALAIVAAGVAANDALVSVALAALLGGYWLLNFGGGLPVLFAAFSFQWLQVCSGYFYTLLTGRMLEATYASDYRTMMYMGLVSIVALAAGIRGGYMLLAQRTRTLPIDRELVSLNTVVVLYIGTLSVTATVQALAWQFPLLTQPIIALTFARLAVLYLLLRRLAGPQFQPIKLLAVMSLEVALGLTSFFAGFREPLVLGILAILEVFDRRRVAHWASVGVLVLASSAFGLMWLGIRTEYRRDFVDVDLFAESRDVRLARIQELTQGWWKQDTHEFWWNLDQLMDRMWPVYYPALAVARVPSVLPHTEGQVLAGALRHILMPRLLFPDKPALESDSEMVRKYAGVWVAGAEQNTSIAFGYVAESYIDFGVPLMFAPVLVWGLFVGAAYRTVQVMIRHREIGVPVLTVVFWLAVYLFERSWSKTMGQTGTLLIYVAGMAYLVDRLLVGVSHKRGVVRPYRTADAPRPMSSTTVS
jgi:hypothetical protein